MASIVAAAGQRQGRPPTPCGWSVDQEEAQAPCQRKEPALAMKASVVRWAGRAERHIAPGPKVFATPVVRRGGRQRPPTKTDDDRPHRGPGSASARQASCKKRRPLFAAGGEAGGRGFSGGRQPGLPERHAGDAGGRSGRRGGPGGATSRRGDAARTCGSAARVVGQRRDGFRSPEPR